MTGPPARIRWGLSVLDWRSHAIDICRDHPGGVYRAQCGHLLLRVVPLWERPVSAPCPTCATLQLELVQAALDRAAAALGEVRSGDLTRRPARRIRSPGRPPVGAGSAAPSSSPLPLVQLPAAVGPTDSGPRHPPRPVVGCHPIRAQSVCAGVSVGDAALRRIFPARNATGPRSSLLAVLYCQGPGPVSGHQWGISTLDYKTHLLLPEGDHPPGVLKARGRGHPHR
jgi:hypothetical protein